MSDLTEPKGKVNKASEREDAPKRQRSLAVRVLRATGWTLLIVVLLVVGLLAGLTFYYTPARLTALVNRELADRFDADVRVGDVNYTFWSTFPNLHVSIDSLGIRSRALRGLSHADREKLPSNAEQLLKISRINAIISMPALLKNHIRIRDVDVDGMAMNLVTVNDSIANYNILPAGLKLPAKMPRISLDTLHLMDLGPIKATFLEKGIDADIDIRQIALSNRDGNDVYDVDIRTMADATYKDRSYLRSFPVDVKGRVKVDFNPVQVSSDKLALMLGSIDATTSFRFEFKDKPMVMKFDCRVGTFRVDRLLEQLSLDEFIDIGGLSLPVEMNADVKLTRPYDIAVGGLPAMLAKVNIPRGSLFYSSNEYGDYSLKSVTMTALLHLDGSDLQQVWLAVPSLHLGDKEAGLELQARVTRLFSDPYVEANVKGQADLATILSMVNGGSMNAVNGSMDMATTVRFNVSDIRKKDFRKIDVGGHLTLDDLEAKVPGILPELGVRRLMLKFKAGADGPADAAFTGGLSLDLGIRGLRLKYAMSDGSINMHLNDADIKGHLIAEADGTPNLDRIKAMVKGSSFEYKGKGARASLSGVELNLRGEHSATPVSGRSFVAPASWHVDDASTKFLTTTPRFLSVSLPVDISSMLSHWNAVLQLKGKKGKARVASYPIANEFSDISLTTNLDSLRVESLKLRSGRTTAAMTGTVANFRQFLTSATPVPLRARLDVNIGAADINEISAAYRRGFDVVHGAGAFDRMLADTRIQPSDSMAVLIPRNLFATVNMKIGEMSIIDVPLRTLSGKISMGDGVARVDTFRLDTDFAEVGGAIGYNTSDLQKMHLSLNAGLSRMTLADLYQSFPELLKKAPPVRYLSGNLKASVSASLTLFPRMYFDIPSLQADMNVHGSDVWMRRNKTIRHITRMMLIPGNGPIHFDNLDIHVMVKDNMLMLYPFNIDFSNYSIEVLGMSNFAGDIFYHVGLEKSPLPIPFGVNVKGTFAKPQLRFGGKEWRGIRGSEIAAGIMDYEPVNLPSTLRHGLLELVDKAADYEEKGLLTGD